MLREKKHGKENGHRYPEYGDARDARPPTRSLFAIKLDKAHYEQDSGENEQPRPKRLEYGARARHAESSKKRQREAAGKRAEGA